jgi:imidazole glycerol-phosphate synthase subunit HisH
MIAIIDYGMGNVGSIRNMLTAVGAESAVTRDPERVRSASHIILPGVGHFDLGMKNLHASGVLPHLTELALERRVPFLGICLGMQLMTRRSEEGTEPGLGWINAECVRFAAAPGLRVPHMGWNTSKPVRASPLLHDLDPEQRYYFVHSYRVVCADRSDVLLVARHGVDFDAAFARGSLYGVQFHPEKSHRFGMALLRNFVDRA